MKIPMNKPHRFQHQNSSMWWSLSQTSSYLLGQARAFWLLLSLQFQDKNSFFKDVYNLFLPSPPSLSFSACSSNGLTPLDSSSANSSSSTDTNQSQRFHRASAISSATLQPCLSLVLSHPPPFDSVFCLFFGSSPSSLFHFCSHDGAPGNLHGFWAAGTPCTPSCNPPYPITPCTPHSACNFPLLPPSLVPSLASLMPPC